jgi:hypothetical protein
MIRFSPSGVCRIPGTTLFNISGTRWTVPGLLLMAMVAMLAMQPFAKAWAMPPVMVDVGGVDQFSATLRMRARGPSEVAVQVYRRARIPGARQPRLRYYGRPQVLFFERYGIPPGGQDRAMVVEGLSPDGVYYYRAWTPEGYVVQGRFWTRR